MADYVRAAIERDLKEIGFAEHIPLPQIRDITGRMDLSEFPTYCREIEAAQKEFPQIQIRFGLEADYISQHLDYIAGFIQAYPFDYIIGSVHYLGIWNFDHPDYVGQYEAYGVDHVYRDYYKLLQQAASCGLFDIIGHFDLPKKFGHVAVDDCSDAIDATLKMIKQKDLTLDVNTSGLRKPVGDIYPSEDILRRAFVLGIPISLGSDAHRPQEVGYHFNQTVALLQNIGYREYVSFEKRKRYKTSFDFSG